MSSLIVTRHGDVHADAVAWALNQLNAACHVWLPFTAQSRTLSANISDVAGHQPTLRAHNIYWPPDRLGSVWLRRYPRVNAPNELSAEDREFLAREMDYFYRGIKTIFGSASLVANPLISSEYADLKAPQLLEAKRAGLSIPNTLLSNDPAEVLAFIRSSPGNVIYKSHSPAVWNRGNEMFSLATSLVTEQDLEGIEEGYFNPGIFQYYIQKAYELRVSIFGHTCIAAKIENQDELDWRRTYEMTLSPYKLPEKVERKLIAFMKKMGLAMGMVDMIVTPDGDFVFLEVNEQGQFLWVEEMNSQIRLLEPFASFLASNDPTHRWDTQKPVEIRYEDYLQSDWHRKFVAASLDEEYVQSAWIIHERGEYIPTTPVSD